MTRDVRAQKGMLLLGARRSGKGTIVKLISKLVSAEEFTPCNIDNWAKGEFSSHNLIGARAIVFADVRLKEGRKYGQTWDAGGMTHVSIGKLLEITAGDPTQFRKMHSTEIEWAGILPGKVTFVSNVTPDFNDDVLPTRWVKLHFKIDTEAAGTIDARLGEKLERELPGIARRALKAYGRVRERIDKGQKPYITQPASGLALDRQIAAARFPLQEMVRECLEFSDGPSAEWAIKGDAHRACVALLRENGQGVLASMVRQEDMGEHLAAVFDHLAQLAGRDRFVQRVDTTRRWRNLRLTTEGQRLTGLEIA
jgi:putative DNA primase/helicase